MAKNPELASLLNTISFWTLTIGIAMYTLLLIIICFISPEWGFIRSNPVEFVIELIAFPTFASLPIILFAYFRGLKVKETVIIFLSFWFKIFILHLLLEITGFYLWASPPKPVTV
jgi:hypothetical protein